MLLSNPVWGQPYPFEIHDRLEEGLAAQGIHQIALTLDACTGRYDDDLIEFLVRYRIPATIFATKRWLDHNPRGVAVITNHLDLFDVEDHGENHIPAVIGAGRKVYGIPGEPDLIHLRREVLEGARAVEAVTGVAPHWYRGATAMYDAPAVEEIRKLGYGIAGFSVNADLGATLKKQSIVDRLKQVRAGDVIIAHMNKPTSDTAEGLSVALKALLDQGFVFVRLDQVRLKEVGERPAQSDSTMERLLH
jgi:peptidoglycan/xylan/chitin deacetylase (PgdA/CDA1 family)